MSVKKSQNQLPPSERAAKSVNQKSNQAWFGRGLWFGLGITSVALVSATAGALLAVCFASRTLMQSQLNQKQAAVFDGERISGAGLQLTQLTRPVNILVLAMSVLPDDVKHPPPDTLHLSYSPQLNSFEGLSDTMLLLRFEPQTQKMVVLSIPRDTRTSVSGHGVEKINAANQLGGVALSAKTVSALLEGVQIDRYLRINVEGFAKLVDALGGIDFYVPKDMKYKDDTQHLYINLKAGQQHLNGDQALQLLRFRYDALGDIGRIQRQQLVMRALIEQSLNPVTLAKFPQILAVIQSYIDTNFTVDELFSVLGFAASTNRSNLKMLMMPGRFSEPHEYNTSYWLPNQKGIAALMAQHFDLTDHSPQKTTDLASLKITIQDSIGQSKAVRALVRRLAASGYPNVQLAQPWPEPLSVTYIVAQQGDSDSAEAIKSALGFGEVRVESTGILGSDVTIHLGKDWLSRTKNSVGVTKGNLGKKASSKRDLRPTLPKHVSVNHPI